MVNRITLEVDREFLEGYRNYKIDEILKDDNVTEVTYSLLNDFINKSTYNLNRLFEELEEDVYSIELQFKSLTVKRNHHPSAMDGMDDLFGRMPL